MLVIVTAHYTVIMDRLTLILEYKLYSLLWLFTIVIMDRLTLILEYELYWLLWLLTTVTVNCRTTIKALFYYFNLCNVG
jgi:hypothetical protein